VTSDDDLAARLDELTAARIDAARRRRDARRALYAEKARRRDAGLAARHRRKLARQATTQAAASSPLQANPQEDPRKATIGS
jgi:hypothetical protein